GTEVGGTRSVRRELREHQRRLWRAAAELAQGPAAEIEYPVVAPRVLAPHLARIGEHQQPPAVTRPDVVGDLQRRAAAFRRELRGRNEDRSRTALRVVADDVRCAMLIRGTFDRRIRRAVRQPACRAEARDFVLARLEDAANLRVERPDAVALLRVR